MENQNKVNEILTAHGLDFNISKRPLFDDAATPTGYFGLFNDRLNKCINTVRKGYTVSQNREIVEMILEGTSAFGDQLRVTKAGSMNEGRKVFIQLAIAGMGKVGKDTIEKFITIIDSNDGTTSLSVGIGDLTMSCQNQFVKFYKRGEKMRHNVSLIGKLKEMPMLIETALNRSLKQIDLYNRLAEYAIPARLIDEMVNHAIGFDRVYTSVEALSEKSTRSINKMDELYAAIESEIKDKNQTLWGLHSGVTKFTTHDMQKMKRANGFEESLMIGGAYKMNQRSLNFVSKKSGILEMA